MSNAPTPPSPPSPRTRSPVGVGPIADGYEVGGLPARLLGVPFPSAAFFQEEPLAGVHWVVCLSSEQPERRYDPTPLQFLRRVRLDSPFSGQAAACSAVADLATTISDELQAGHGVVVHCDLGIERTGSVIGTVLARHGVAPPRAAELIADVIELQQPGWAGSNFADHLAQAIQRCTPIAPAR